MEVGQDTDQSTAHVTYFRYISLQNTKISLLNAYYVEGSPCHDVRYGTYSQRISQCTAIMCYFLLVIR